MPLVLDANSMPLASLEELRRSLRADLEETRDFVDHPSGRVIDPASLATAQDLLRSALARLDVPGPTDAETICADVNLAYATLIAVIDLVKSHTEVPRVPRPSKKV